MSDLIHGGQVVAKKLVAEGVRHVFTLTGGHISPIYDGCAREGSIRLLDFRHEQAAVHAADGFARLNRQASVAAVTAGPGLTGAITGIANAYYSQSPVVLLGGSNPIGLAGMGSLQDAPQPELLKPITKRTDTVLDAFRIGEVLNYAFNAALSQRYGPVYIDLPLDVQLSRVNENEVIIPKGWSAKTLAGPDTDAVNKFLDLLSRSKRPVAIAGSGAYWSCADTELERFAAISQVPLFLNGQARGLLHGDNEFLFNLSRREALQRADLLIILGADLDFRLGYGRPPQIPMQLPVIQVDPASDRLGHNRPLALGITSDVRGFLREVLRHDDILACTRTDWLAELRSIDHAKTLVRHIDLSSNQVPIHPLRFAAEVSAFLDEDAVVVLDGGDIAALTASVVRVNRPGHWLDPGPFGCLGVGVPFAMAARLTHPSKQIVCVLGDGAFGFNGFEYDSSVRHDLPFIGVMGNDGAWGEMRTFHEKLFGNEHMECQYLNQSTAYHKVVEALGGYGERVDRPEDIRPALKRAAESGLPSLVNVLDSANFSVRSWALICQSDIG